MTFTIAAAAAWLCVHAIRRWAMRRRVLDVPNDRSLHKAPVPTGGGLAIVGVFAAGLLFSVLSAGQWPPVLLATFAGGALLIAAVSWIDDLRPLPVWVRLLTQIAAAVGLLCVCSMDPLKIELPSPGVVEPGRLWTAVGLLIAFFWLVGMTNAYNFMDGVDGMAGGMAVVAGLGWFALATFYGASPHATLGLVLAAAGGGFLLHNRPPARIFMGDVGSAFLGFTFASMVLMAVVSDAGNGADARLAAGGAILLWPFVFDTLTTFMYRLSRGENVFTAHRGHLYQRLCLVGWPHGSVSLLYAMFSVLGALAATAMVIYPGAGDWAVVFAMPLLVAVLWIFGRFQTTEWDEPHPYAAEWATQNESTLDGSWVVSIRLDDQTVSEIETQPTERPTHSKPAA